MVSKAAALGDQLIGEELCGYIDYVREKENIKGLSLVVVNSAGADEFRTWGIRAETGDPVSSNVDFLPIPCSRLNSDMLSLDSL